MNLPSNRLLAALFRSEDERLLPAFQSISLTSKQILHRQGERPDRVIFPSRGVCSAVAVMKDGATIEVGMIGSEGMTGLCVVPEETFCPVDVRVQMADDAAQVIGIGPFREEMARSGTFAGLVHRYSQAFRGQTMQAAACHGLHGVEERCCRWLLMVHDRIGCDELQVTQEAISVALGVRRPTITLTISALRSAGLIGPGTRRITILNRKGLEAVACECYRTIQANYDQLLPREQPAASRQQPRAV